MPDRLLTRLGAVAPHVMAAGVFAGLLLPGLAAWLRPTLPLWIFLLLVLAMLRVDWLRVAGLVRRPLPLVVALCALVLATPALVAAGMAPLVAIGVLPVGLGFALVLMTCAPPIGSSANMAAMMRLDADLALLVSLAATLLVPVVAPITVAAFTELDLAIDPGALALRLTVLVGGALLVSLALRRFWPRPRLMERAGVLDGMTALAMLGFALGIMDGVGERALAEPGTVLLGLAVACGANLALQTATAAAALALPRRLSGIDRTGALTLGLLGGNRNMGLLLGALPAAVDPWIGLHFALAQIPMYLTPLLAGPVYRRLVGIDRGAGQ